MPPSWNSTEWIKDFPKYTIKLQPNLTRLLGKSLYRVWNLTWNTMFKKFYEQNIAT